MNRKIVFWLSGLIVIAAVGFFVFRDSKKDPKLEFVPISKGNISQTITSTGTLQALSTVDVGTQVSGRIAKLFVDFNSNVKKGQLLAILDTTLLAAQVRDAQAALAKIKAQVEQLQDIHEKNKVLYQKNLISEVDFITSQTNLATAKSDYLSAQSALDRAKTNLGYAFIRSPINGTVQNRNIEQGQTVAASLASPTLFTIAEDLSEMKILANVDESDIGQIKDGQKVDFTVEAFPDKKFTGIAVQIRINSQVVSNVVNYTVVINADNPDKILLPGMTATVNFYIVERDNVLLIPNAALRFQPTDEMLKTMQKEGTTVPSADTTRKKRMAAGTEGTQGGNNHIGRLWYFDKNKNLKMAVVQLGITDGKSTEIIRGRNVQEGLEVISGINDNSAAQNSQRPGGNILNPGSMQRGMRRGF